MTSDYSTEAQAVADAMNAVYENKQTNKKNTLSGDYSSDNASYPTCKAVQAAYGTKVNSWSSTVSDSNIPTEKLVKDTLDTKQATLVSGTNIKTINNTSLLGSGNITIQEGSNIDIVTSWEPTLSDSKVASEKLTKNTIDTMAVTVEKQQTAETGYAHTYVIKQGGTALSPKINIPKDFLVKSGEVKTCTTANVPVQGYVVGDKYLDFVVNVKEGSATDEHIYILVKDLVDVYTADNSTLQLSNGQFSIKNGGVGSDQIASAVKSSWLSTSDVQSEISTFAAALAEAINPTTT